MTLGSSPGRRRDDIGAAFAGRTSESSCREDMGRGRGCANRPEWLTNLGGEMDYASCRSLPAMFFEVATQRAARPFLWAKRDGKYHPLSWGEAADAVRRLARGLAALGIEAGDRVALVSENRPEWVIADLAIMAAGAVTVPAYVTNTVEDHRHILGNSGARAAIVSTASLAARLIPAAAQVPSVRTVIAIEDVGEAPQGLDLRRWDSVLALGGAESDDTAGQIARLAPDDTACLIYTSGTGGVPKGVMLSHRNIIANCRGAYRLLEMLGLGDERFLSFLPLSHSYEHTAGMMFPISLGERLIDPVLEKLVRDKVRARFGGHLKAMVSGGAPLNPEIGGFFLALGVQLLQGYGQTEAAPVICCNPPGHIRVDTVGPPLDGVEVRIAEDGEILVAGDNVMKGYWNAPEASARTLIDGWLHTGDIGDLDPDGYLRITDRKRDFIKNSGGDMISPARVEGALTLMPEIAQAMVFGDQRPYLVAVIVPDPEFAAGYAAAGASDLAAFAQDPGLHKALGDVVARVNEGLAVAERVRRFTIAGEPFSLDNAQLTPTLKIRRHAIRDAYQGAFEMLYDGRGMAA